MRQRWNANAKETEEKNTESWQLGIQACVRTLNEKQFAMANIYRVTHQERLDGLHYGPRQPWWQQQGFWEKQHNLSYIWHRLVLNQFPEKESRRYQEIMSPFIDSYDGVNVELRAPTLVTTDWTFTSVHVLMRPPATSSQYILPYSLYRASSLFTPPCCSAYGDHFVRSDLHMLSSVVYALDIDALAI